MHTHPALVTENWIDDVIRRGMVESRRSQTPVWVGDTTDIPRFPLFSAFGRQRDAWVFAEPGSRPILGIGIAGQWSFPVAGNTAGIVRLWRTLSASSLPRELRLGGGWAFTSGRTAPDPLWDGFPAMSWTLPAFQLIDEGDRVRLIMAAEVAPWSDTAQLQAYYRALLASLADEAADEAPVARRQALREIPDPRTWMRRVEKTRRAIEAGRMEKAVLARRVDAVFDRPLSISHILANLSRDNPDATVFGLSRGSRTFLGATPELLAAVENRSVSSMCLAGTTRRGATPEEDRTLAQDLLSQSKNLAEHLTVRRHIIDALTPLCLDLEWPPTPSVRTLPALQHLYTPIHGVLREGEDIWSVAQALHPTPAVAGAPVVRATEWIADVEGFDRGWYAGVVGHVSLAGDGALAVALRSALVDRARARASLFAGCGIMRDSVPAHELRESGWKLEAMLRALDPQAPR